MSSEFCIDFLLVTKPVLLIADLITPCMKGVVPIMLVIPFSIKQYKEIRKYTGPTQ
jgi:hypothetical protein